MKEELISIAVSKTGLEAVLSGHGYIWHPSTLDIGCHHRLTRRLQKEDLKAHCISSYTVFPKFCFPKRWELQLPVAAVSVFIFLYSTCQHGIWVRCPLMILVLPSLWNSCSSGKGFCHHGVIFRCEDLHSVSGEGNTNSPLEWSMVPLQIGIFLPCFHTSSSRGMRARCPQLPVILLITSL